VLLGYLLALGVCALFIAYLHIVTLWGHMRHVGTLPLR
jgi:hypothetical protein